MLTCPVCDLQRPLSEFDVYLSQLKSMHQQQLLWWWSIHDYSWATIEKVFSQEKRFSDQMACDPCFDKGVALIADPIKQHFCDWPPYLAYIDQSCSCKACQHVFVFSKHEQLSWYEHYYFWVQSRPAHCLTCRQQRRQDRSINRDLSLLLSDGLPELANKSQRVAELYIEMEKPEKARRYQNLAEKQRQQEKCVDSNSAGDSR